MDPADVEQPWYFHCTPDDPAGIARNFAATTKRVIFMGHYHRWLLAGTDGKLRPVPNPKAVLAKPDRYLVVVPGVCDGWAVWYDTDTGELEGERFAR